MSQQFEAPHPNGAVTRNEKPKRRRFLRPFLYGVLVVVIILWGYAIWFSVTRQSPENLDKDAQAAVANACATALQSVKALPDLPKKPTAEEVVTLVRQENGELTTMVDRIDAVDTDGADANKALHSWVDDWRSVIAARATFADDLAADGTARLNIPAVKKGGLEPVTDRMDTYALGRNLDDCRPEQLQVEVVDQPRNYTKLVD